MASVNFKIGVDDSEVTQKLDKVINKVEAMGNVSQKVGREIKTALAEIKGLQNIDEAFAKIDEIAAKNKEAMAELVSKIRELKDASDKAFEAKEYKRADLYGQQARDLEELLQVRQRLQGEIESTADSLNKESQAAQQATEKQVSFRTELMHTMNEYRQMTMAMSKGEAVDPEKYEAVRDKLIEMRAAMAKMNHEMQILASQTPTLSGLIAAARGVTGVFSVAQGVLGVFNSKSEDMQKIMMRVQSLMAVMMGLQQLQTTLLQKDAILMTTVGRLKKWWTTITKANTAATVAETAATGGLTTAFKALGIAIKSIPGLGWLIAGISAAVAVVSRLTKSSREAAKAIEDMFSKIADGSAEGITEINALEAEWNKIRFSPLKDDFLKDAIKKFQKLGYAINDVRQAEELLSDPARVETLRRAEMAKAQAESARALIVEKTKQQLQAKLLMEGYAAVYNNAGWWSKTFGRGAQAGGKMLSAWEDYQQFSKDIERLSGWEGSASTQFTELLNTLGIGTYTGDKITDKGSKSKLATAEEIAREYNAFVDSALDKVDDHIKQRHSDIRKSMTAEMEDGLEKTLQRLTDEQLEAQDKIDKWWDDFNDKAIAKLRDLYKKQYGKDAPTGEAAENDANWQKMFKGWVNSAAYKKGFAEYITAQQQAKDAFKQATEKARKEDAEKEAADMLKSLTMQEEYEKEKLEITKKYTKLIAEAKLKGDEEEAKRLANKGKNEIDELTTRYNKEQAELFESTSNRSRKSLETQMLKLQQRLKTLKDTKGTLEEIKDVQEQMDEVQDALDEKENQRATSVKEIVLGYAKALGLQQKANQLEEQAEEARRKGNIEDAERLEKRAERLRQQAQAIIEGLGKPWEMAVTAIVEGFQLAADYAQKIADITGDASIAEWASEANALAQNLNAAWQGYQSTGSPYGAIAAGATDMISQTISASLERRAWIAEFNRAIKNFRAAIELAAVTFDPDKFETMFGTKSLASAAEAYTKMNEAQALYQEKVTKAFQLGDRQKRNANLGNAIFQANSFLGSVSGLAPLTGLLSSFAGFRSKTTQKWYSELDAYQRGLNQLQAIQVLTKRHGGWAKFWGKSDKYQSLFDVAPEIWGGDINGEFDVEKARKFLEVSKQLTDEQRDQIEQAIELKEAYDEAREALENVISETVGSFADDMANAVWEAITTGADAWKIFEEKGNEALVSLGKQMLKEFAISTYLENFTDKLKEAYGSGDMNSIAQIYTEIFDGIPMVLENMTIAGQQWVQMLKENGYDVTAKGASSGSTGGYQTAMSHEDASEINGRMTDVQMQLRGIAANMMQVVSLQQETRGFARMQTDYLYDIRRYSSSLPSIAEYAKKIATNTANL